MLQQPKIELSFDNLIKRQLHFYDSVDSCIGVGEVLHATLTFSSVNSLPKHTYYIVFGYKVGGESDVWVECFKKRVFCEMMPAGFEMTKKLEIPIPEEGPITFVGNYFSIHWELQIRMSAALGTFGKHATEVIVVPKTVSNE